jgi:hypothetical protein
MSAPESPPSPKNALFAGSRLVWIVAILITAALAVFFGNLWLGNKAIDTAGSTVQKGVNAAKQAVEKIAEAFRPESISQTFVTYTDLAVKGTEGNILEVATAQATEHFTRKTNLVWFERVVPFSTAVSEISVPATYRYHIDLHGPWDLAAYDGRVTVIAPPLQPSLPVAFDTGKMEKKTESGWARWDRAADTNLAELEASLTGQLAQRATAPETLRSVREASRLAIAKFVKNWLQTGQHWGEETYREIVIVFPDEVGQPNSPSLMERPATLRWRAGTDDDFKGSNSATPLP